MLQSLRAKFMGWPGVIIFGALGLLMAVAFGVGNYSISNQDTWVAKVGDHEISNQQYQQAMNNLRQQMSNAQGASFDPSYFQKPEVKQQVVRSLVDRYLMTKSGSDLGLVITDNQIRQQIANTPVFQSNGKFDPETYKAVLASNGMSPLMYQGQVKSDLESRILPSTLAQTSMVSAADVDAYLRLQLQTRSFSYVVLPKPELTDDTVTDEQVKQYYDAHQKELTRPEQVSLSYIELNADTLPLDQPITDDTLKARYEQEKARFTEPEQRKVAHILIKVPSDATKEQRQAALEKAEKVDKLAKAPGADFAALAKQYSQDAGSRLTGGELGWLQQGTAGKAFDAAMFALKKGQISKPVLGADGYHIIWLQDVRPGKSKPFSEVRDQLAKEAESAERAREYSKLAGELTDLAYANPTTLQAAANKLGLTIKHTGLFSRDGTKEGLASNPRIVRVAFSENVLKNGNNSDPVTLGNNHIAIVRLDKHEKAVVPPLEDVSGKIRTTILADRVNEQARKQADEMLAKLEKSGDFSAFAKQAGLAAKSAADAQRGDKDLPAEIVAKAFAMPVPAAGKPDYAKVAMPNGQFALLALTAMKPGDAKSIPAPIRRSLLAQLRSSYAATTSREWLAALHSSADIKVAKDRL